VSSTAAILAIVGASGVGKTTVLHMLTERRLPGVGCYHFDSIGVPSPEAMRREFGGPENWQAAMTDRWIERLAANEDGIDVAVLEGQTRPSFLKAAFARCGIQRTDIVLLDCSPEERSVRLNGPRASRSWRPLGWIHGRRTSAGRLMRLALPSTIPPARIRQRSRISSRDTSRRCAGLRANAFRPL
jgi:hypothetical protein